MSDPWDTLSPRVVMVANFSERDGIGRYAEQLMAADRGGRSFLRVGVPIGPGDYARAFDRGLRGLWLLRDARRRDDVVVQYHPHYFFSGGSWSRTLGHATWGVLGLLRRLTYVAHERDADGAPRVEEAVRGWAWRRARTIVFLSQWGLDRHVERFGRSRRQRLMVAEHGDFFTTSVAASPDEARARLGLPADRVMLLMIGFLSARDPDKGYDRGIDAVVAAGEPAVDLHIVGSPIREGPEIEPLLEQLRAADAEHAQIHFHEAFVDDEAFDLWLRAADAVLTPYRTGSSSGVVARAHLLGTAVVTSDAGGLAEQALDGDTVIRSDEDLVEAVRTVAQASRRRYSAS